MEFPLSVVVDFLVDEGFSISYAPKNQNVRFQWVSAVLPHTYQPNDQTLYVCDNERSMLISAPVVLLGDFRPTNILNPSIIFVKESDTSPIEMAELIQRYLTRIYQWVERMHNLLADKASCEEVLASSEPILKSYISVSDALFRYIAHTPHIAPIEEESRYLVEHGHYRPEAIETALKSNMGTHWESAKKTVAYAENAINKRPSIEHVYRLNNQYAAHLLMVCPTPITQGQAFLFTLLIKPIEVILKNQWLTKAPFTRRYTSFLSTLIRADSSRQELVEHQAKLLDIPTTGIYKVLAIDNSWRGGSSEYYAERITNLAPHCWVLVKETVTLVILCLQEGRRSQRLSDVENQVFDLVRNSGTKVGVSQKFFKLTDIRRASIEARIALKYGRVCFRHFVKPGENAAEIPDSYIFRFKRYFPFFVGDPDANLGRFMRQHNVADEIIGAIEREDQERGTVDGPILRAFLYYGGKVSAVCEALGLPRNTVLYRLKRIEDTYDLDLRDPDERIFVQTLLFIPR